MRRKVLSILLTLIMVFTMMPATAFAEVSNEPIAQIDEMLTQGIEPPQTVSGEGTSDNPWLIGTPEANALMAWVDSGVLNIAGHGDMMDFTPGAQPWTSIGITSISFNTVAGKITSIGDNAFNGCSNLVTVNQIPATVVSIGDYAFAGCSSLITITVKSEIPAIIGTDVFEATTKVIVPKDSKSAYESAWSSYASNITCAYSLKKPASFPNGSVVFASYNAYVGETVTLHVKAYNNCHMVNESLKVTYNNGANICQLSDPVPGTGSYSGYSDYSFTMPAADVDIAATFVKDEDPTPAIKVCKLGNTEYKTLEAAVKEVRNKQTITLLSDTTAELISIQRKVTFTIDSNNFENHATIIAGQGYKITKSTKGSQTTYKVSCQLIDRELAGRILNTVLNAAEPVIRAIMCIARHLLG